MSDFRERWASMMELVARPPSRQGAVFIALRAGRLKKGRGPHCGTRKVQAPHLDYKHLNGSALGITPF